MDVIQTFQDAVLFGALVIFTGSYIMLKIRDAVN